MNITFLQQQIKQIDFVLNNPADPVSKIFLEHNSADKLKKRRESYAEMLSYKTATPVTQQ